MLNNDIIDLGKKIKIFFHIARSIKIEIDKNIFIRILQIRNCFAHTDTTSSHYPLLTTSEVTEFYDFQHMTRTIKSDGEVEFKKREELFQEFQKKLDEALKVIYDIKNKLGINT